jgi:hypothetical protein
MQLGKSPLLTGAVLTLAMLAIVLVPVAGASERGSSLHQLRDIVAQYGALHGKNAGYARRCANDGRPAAVLEQPLLARVKRIEEETGAALTPIAEGAFSEGLAAAGSLACAPELAASLADGLLLVEETLGQQVEILKAILDEDEPGTKGTSAFVRPTS